MFNLARNWRLEMLRRSIQITVLKDTERLTDLREGVHRERERGSRCKFSSDGIVCFSFTPWARKARREGSPRPLFVTNATDEVSINSGCVTEIRETNIHIYMCIRMHSQKKEKKVNVATLTCQ